MGSMMRWEGLGSGVVLWGAKSKVWEQSSWQTGNHPLIDCLGLHQSNRILLKLGVRPSSGAGVQSGVGGLQDVWRLGQPSWEGGHSSVLWTGVECTCVYGMTGVVGKARLQA